MSLASRILALAAVLAFAAPAAAQHRGIYNDPDIHGETIVFVSEGDLWRVSTEGGSAVRLTSDPGLEVQPRISPDGRTIAFGAQYDGNMDVYTMPIEGGEPTRLTWHPYADLPSDWTPDGASILYYTAQNHPHYARETWIIPAEGGVPQPFPIGTSCYAVLAPDGRTVAFNRNFVQRRTWKRYGGGLADDIWIGDVEAGTFKRLTTYFGNDLTPQFAAGRLYFLSERDGRMNLWSMTHDGDDLSQHTFFEDFDVQNLGTDGQRLVFQQGGDIHLFDPATDEAVRLDIVLPTDRARTRPQLPNAAKFVDDFSLSNDGRKMLVTTRGDIFNVPVKTGTITPVKATRGVRESGAQFAGKDDEFAVYFSDVEGNYELFRADARTGENVERLTNPDDENRGFFEPFFPITVSPDGSKIAFADQRATVYWIGTTTPTLTIVDRSEFWETRGYEWSPDNRYLAYEKVQESGYTQVWIHDSESGENHAVTDGMYYSYSPTWDPEGKFLFFLSDRTFKRARGNFEYETIMVEPTVVYALPLNHDVDNPLRDPDPYEEDAEKKEKKDSKKDDKKTTETLKLEIQFENIAARAVPFDMNAGDYSGLTAAKGRVFYFRRGERTDLMVYEYTAEKREAKVFAEKVRGYTLSRNREHIAWRIDDKISVAKASAAKADSKDPSPRIDSANLLVDPRAEWRQMFTEVYRYYRDYFYVPNMAGQDWEEIVERYRPLVDRVSIRQELTDLIGNMIAELGHGHTYIMGDGDAPTGRTVATGLLGVDFSIDEENNQVVLGRIYRGERWDPALESPFGDRRLREVESGWRLLAVNGREVTTDIDPLSHFWGLAGQEVLLSLSPTADKAEARDFRVKLISDENALRWDEWVRGRRDYVTEQSNGALGYMYLPNMGDRGLYSFFQQFFPQIRREAMVIDIRWNGGGNVSQLLIRRLRHELYALTKSRNFAPTTYPSRTFLGPMAVVMNERCGSDGDIFARSFEHFGLGPLIGTTTWGGTVGIRFQTGLLDGGRVSVPEFGYIDLERGYDIENYGIDPTEGFRVELTPEDELAGRDPQLDRAIEYLMAEKDKPEYRMPELPEPPDRSVPYFRKRSEPWLNRP